jgi:hypothetical protein
VTIKTDLGSGTGFIAKFRDRFFVITNQHVIDGAKTAEIRTRNGNTLRPATFFGAFDADIAFLGLTDYPATSPFFEIESATTFNSKGGDEVIISGNSLGDGVITSTPGKLLNIGPQRIEVDNPVFPGNSGSPIFHVTSGKVIGVLTEAESRDSKKLDRVSKSSIAQTDSQVKSETRYFGHRLDTVTEWGGFEWNRYQQFSQYLQSADDEISHIENFLFGSDGKYQDFEDLHRAVNEADKILSSDKFAEAEYLKAVDRLVQSLASLTFRKIRPIKTNPNNFPRPFFRQKLQIAELEQRAEFLNNEFRVMGRNLDLWKKLIQR